MIIFLYGEDSYRAKRKLEEIIEGYKKVHKSGLSLAYFDAGKPFDSAQGKQDYRDFSNNFKITSMFDEKKMVILKNAFSGKKFPEEFLEDIKKFKDTKDIIVVFENEKVDERGKLFKALKKEAKCQEFCPLPPVQMRKWMESEFKKYGAKINAQTQDLLFQFVGNNLWQLENEIKKISHFSAQGGPASGWKKTIITKEVVELLVRPKIENDIFKTIDALASKNKRQALVFLHKHFDNGDAPLYLLSMISYQFRNLLVIRELMDKQAPYAVIVKKSGLHPFVAQKSYNLCQQFTIEELKKIYQKIFQVDLDIKTGKIEPETALDLFLAEI